MSFRARNLLSFIYLSSNVGRARFDGNFNPTEEEICSFVEVDHPWLFYYIINIIFIKSANLASYISMKFILNHFHLQSSPPVALLC